MNMADENFVMCEYVAARGGSHGVVGLAVFPTQIVANMRRTHGGFVFDYGHRSKGDPFLVHRADVQLMPHLFRPIPPQASGAQRTIQLPQAAVPVRVVAAPKPLLETEVVVGEVVA